MAGSQPYMADAPQRAEVDAWQGLAVLEFGTDWCGYCRAAQSAIHAGLAGGALKHVKVEDGKGRPLGRSFQVKLWPTLIFLRDGREVTRLVRPDHVQQIERALAQARA